MKQCTQGTYGFRFYQAVSRVIFDTDLVATRLILALAEIFWVVMLAWPGDTFGRPTYSGMAALMSEEAWVVVFLVSSITQISVIASGDYFSFVARWYAAWNAALWTFLVTSMLASVYPPPAAIGGEIALALGAIWIWARPIILSIGYRRAIHHQYAGGHEAAG
jgi:hypothetical protein